MKSLIYPAIVFYSAMITAVFPAVHARAVEIDICMKEYYTGKKLGNYAESLKALTGWTIQSDDPVLIETNILRVGELMIYPEILHSGIRACDEIAEGNRMTREDAVLRSRIEILKMQLLMRTGNRRAAEVVRRRLGFIQNFQILGPFRNRSIHDFESSSPVEMEYEQAKTYPGKLYAVRWYEAGTNPAGVMDVGRRTVDTADSLFYAYAEFHAGKTGKYLLHLGKTGYTDVVLDGEVIFRNRKRHGHSHDQYQLKVSMKAGYHRLLIKIGDSIAGGLGLSVRITDESGRGIEFPAKITSTPDFGKSSLISATFFPALDAQMRKAAPSAEDSLTTGYLYYIAGLNSDTGHEASLFLTRALGSPGTSSIAAYYLGMTEADQGKREHYFQEASQSDPGALEPVEQIGRIKLDNNFIYEAFPLARKLIAQNPSSPAGKILRAGCCMKRGWYVEALKLAGQLKAMGYPSAGYAIEGQVLSIQKKYIQASVVFESLHSMDRFNAAYVNDWIDSLEESGQYERAITILESLSPDFPDDPSRLRRLATIVKYARGAEKAIPYLSAALKQSPFDAKILFDLGCVYRAQGRSDTAQFYLQQALLADPDNAEIRDFFEIFSTSENELAPYQVAVEPQFYSIGVEKFKHEPAVVLLDECAVRILADGSYEKTVRKIIRINDADVINEFMEQFVIFNPATDRVEDLRCTVIHDGSVVESSDAYSRSLSDPESRLYYDLQAKIIPVSSLHAGSVIDFRYRIISSDGDYFRGFFGERITAGGEYRTLLTNIIVSYPADRKIYCHLTGIRGKDLKTMTVGNRKMITVVVKNSPPNRKETAMPDLQGMLPSVIFTAHENWESVNRWYMALASDRMVVSAEMRKAVAGLIRKNDDDLEKIRKIFNHVTGAIRYVGFELGLGSIQPRRTDLTYKTGMGDCKDISLVLAAMIREAGLDARMALLRTRDRGELHGAVPFLGQFNHAICYVNTGGGIFLDATSRMSGFRELPSGDREVNAFVIHESGYRFINTGGGIDSPNEEVSETVAAIEKSGRAVLRRRIVKSGDIASDARIELTDESAKIQTISEYWNDLFTGSRVSRLTIETIGTEAPVAYSYEVEVPSLLTPVEGFLVLKSFPAASGYYRMFATGKNRQTPLMIARKTSIRSSIHYIIPAGYRVVRMPESEHVSFGKYNAHFTYVLRRNEIIEVNSVIDFKTYSIDGKEYGRFRGFTRFVDRKENEAIVLQKNPGN